MSESKFNDGRLLRSDDTTLTLEEVRLLYSNLEKGEHDDQDLKKLTRIGDKLEEAMGDYYQQIELAVMRARTLVREGSDPETTERAVNIVINQLDAQIGQEPSEDVILPMTEWQWAKDRWKSVKKSGIKEVRIKFNRIEDVLTNGKGVKFVGKNKVAWIEGENEPEPGYSASRDNPGDSGSSNGSRPDIEESQHAEPLRPTSIGPR